MSFIRKLRLLLLVSTLMLCASLLRCDAARALGLDVHFMDIGRNDGILIVCDGEAAFIDSGSYQYGDQALDYMRSVGVSGLKYYIGTHAHRDHVAGGAKIILAMKPGAVLMPHDGVRSIIMAAASGQAEKAATKNATYITTYVGDTYRVGGAVITVLGPLTIRKFSTYTDLENVNSMVFRLTYGERTFLFTGDATADSLYKIEAANPGALRCDVLKNPHHSGRLKDDLRAICSPDYVVFSTSDRYLPNKAHLESVADIGARALITSPRQNSTTVFHSDGRSLSYTVANGPSSVKVSKSEISIYEGKAQDIYVKFTPSHYRAVTYISQNPSVATVNGRGRVIGVKPGTTVIRALASNGLYDDCTVTVLPISVRLSRSALTVRHGATGYLSASLLPSGTRGRTIAWSSDNPSVATVTDRGRVTGVKPGETTIRATLENGSFAVCAVTVEPVPVSSVYVRPSYFSLTIGQTQALTASVYPKNATDQSIAWSSADESILRVSQSGQLSAVGVGRAKVTATASNGRSHTISVNVKPVYVTSIALSSDRQELTSGVAGKDTLQLTASISPADATIRAVKWNTSNRHIATVDQNGLVTAVGPGRVSIYATATDGSHRQATYRITVNANRFTRGVPVVNKGRLTVSAKQLSYERDNLRVTLYYANYGGEPVALPNGGVLTLILPNGRSLAVAPLEVGRYAVRTNHTSTYTVYLPLKTYPQLAGLDLAACDATVTAGR